MTAPDSPKTSATTWPSWPASGLNSLRLTVEWARVEPLAGRPDRDALDRYLDIVDAATAEDLGVWITLHHTSLPGWYTDDEGGHADEVARRRWWARHVDRMAEAFDGPGRGLVPDRGPHRLAVRGYGLGTRPPGRRSPEAAAEAAEGAMLALHEACRLLESGPQPVMAVFGAPTLHAAPVEREHAHAAGMETRRWDELLWGTWTRALREGAVEVPGRAPVAAPCFEKGPELVGLSHDHPVGVTEAGRFVSWPASARRSTAASPRSRPNWARRSSGRWTPCRDGTWWWRDTEWPPPTTTGGTRCWTRPWRW